MNKRSVTLTVLAALLCLFSQAVFADIAGPTLRPSSGGIVAIVLLIAVLVVAVVLIIRRIRKGK